MVRRCIHGQQWGVHRLIAHPSVLKPLLTFFHLPQKVSEVTQSSLCAFGIARKGLILYWNYSTAIFLSILFVPGLSTGGCEEQTVTKESFTCWVQRQFPANATHVSISTLVLLCLLILFPEVLWVRPVPTTTGTFPSYSLTGTIFSTWWFLAVFGDSPLSFWFLHTGSLPTRTQTVVKVVGCAALLHCEGKRQLSFLSQSFSTAEIPTCLYLFMALQLV